MKWTISVDGTKPSWQAIWLEVSGQASKGAAWHFHASGAPAVAQRVLAALLIPDDATTEQEKQ